MTTIQIPPQMSLFTLATSGILARSLHVVAELGVADAIDGPTGIEDVADRVGGDPDGLHRILRALEPLGIFERDGTTWAHTELSSLLRTDHPTSMRAFVRAMGLPLTWDCVTGLEHSARTGRSVMSELDEDGFFGYLRHHPDERAVFDAAMVGKAQADIVALLMAIDLTGVGTVIDVGGGVGHLVNAILDRYPHVDGAIFELPHVAADIAPRADGRLVVHAGDLFSEPVPEADVAILMHVVHDWADPEAAEILAAVAGGQGRGRTLMLVEALLPDTADPTPVFDLDLLMLSCTGGRERTEDEYRALLDAAGYDLVETTQLVTGMHLLRAIHR